VAVSPDIETTPKVAHVATAIKLALRDLGSGWVEGEVQNLKSAGSGHVYFRLADEDAVLDCVMWRTSAARLSSLPDEGTLVQAHFERVDFYGKAGRTSLHVDRLRPTGEGELLRRKEQALRRLEADGMTDPTRRRALPRFPRRVGVVAARNSDAKVDVIKSLRERFPAVQVVFRPAVVEGVHAVDSMIEALIHLQAQPAVDVIVLARGGGGVRELVAFDDLKLCRAIFACDKPVVTSIGHTQQRPNCDHVAAGCADVPARAAELVVPSASELLEELDRQRCDLGAAPARLEATQLRLAQHGARLASEARDFYVQRAQTLDLARHRLARVRQLVPAPGEIATIAAPVRAAGRTARKQYHDFSEAIGRRAAEARRAAARRLHGAAQDLDHVVEVIEAKDFRRRGWVLVGDGHGRPARSALERRAGEELDLRFADGRAKAVVSETHTDETRQGDVR
jgi:exodeoxyribonuclease VII large subunit